MPGRISIVSGGPADPDFVARYIKKFGSDIVIAADKGLDTCVRAGIVPDIVLGDYDSTGMRGRIDEMRQSGAYVEVYPAEKDFTDTEAAVMCALRKGAEEIVILGATGGRLDHFLANLDLCLVPLRRGVKCTLADEHNELRLLDRGITLCADEAAGRYISLLPFTDLVSGVTLTGMKYPLLDAPLVRGSSLGVSNEVTGETARIDFREGILILVLSRD